MLVLAACGSSVATASSPSSSQLQAVVAASELVVGKQQRVPIGLTDHNSSGSQLGSPITTPP